ncbi:hypothetical protein D3C73_847470 [compost metagenome]
MEQRNAVMPAVGGVQKTAARRYMNVGCSVIAAGGIMIRKGADALQNFQISGLLIIREHSDCAVQLVDQVQPLSRRMSGQMAWTRTRRKRNFAMGSQLAVLYTVEYNLVQAQIADKHMSSRPVRNDRMGMRRFLAVFTQPGPRVLYLGGHLLKRAIGLHRKNVDVASRIVGDKYVILLRGNRHVTGSAPLRWPASQKAQRFAAGLNGVRIDLALIFLTYGIQHSP